LQFLFFFLVCFGLACFCRQKGNGNAAIFRHEPRVFTFSVHCAQNLFSAQEQSDCDVALEAGCGDDEYLECLETKLDEVGSLASFLFAPSARKAHLFVRLN